MAVSKTSAKRQFMPWIQRNVGWSYPEKSVDAYFESVAVKGQGDLKNSNSGYSRHDGCEQVLRCFGCPGESDNKSTLLPVYIYLDRGTIASTDNIYRTRNVTKARSDLTLYLGYSSIYTSFVTT